MLPASSHRKTSSGSDSNDAGFDIRQSIIVASLMLYAFAVGIGLLSGVVRPERAFLLMAAPCCVPAVWYANAYLKSQNERDSGLLLSAGGWLLIALALLFKQIAVARAGDTLAALQASTPPVPICATFGVLCLLAGGIFSWLFWASSEESSAPPSAHY